MIQLVLPQHLRTLARLNSDVELEVSGTPTIQSVLDALEETYPMLKGTIRDHATKTRRPFIRFFACQQDISHDPPDTPLPDPIVSGREPIIIIGAIAGG